MKATKHILLCDDDRNLSTLMATCLKKAGYAVDCVTDGDEALKLLSGSHYDFCLLDVMLPGVTGLEVLKQLREMGKDLPVVMVSARTAEEDILAGYAAGCDDYVCKPFSMDVLLCKLEVLSRLRQRNAEETQTQFQIGSLCFDSVRQTLNGNHLSSKENDVLLLLCRNRNKLVDRSQILKAVWSTDNYFAARSLAVYINHLRNHLKTEQGVKIMSVHGKGYKLVLN